jgi:hypothetical protein
LTNHIIIILFYFPPFFVPNQGQNFSDLLLDLIPEVSFDADIKELCNAIPGVQLVNVKEIKSALEEENIFFSQRQIKQLVERQNKCCLCPHSFSTRNELLRHLRKRPNHWHVLNQHKQDREDLFERFADEEYP